MDFDNITLYVYTFICYLAALRVHAAETAEQGKDNWGCKNMATNIYTVAIDN